MKSRLNLFFGFVLVSMLIVTTWASMHESVMIGGAKIIQEPWGIATLFDTYFAFITFYLWVLYKEQNLLSRVLWFILIMLLGNIAMAVYVLWQIKKSKTDTFEGIFLVQKTYSMGFHLT